jgi:hypothetical protein
MRMVWKEDFGKLDTKGMLRRADMEEGLLLYLKGNVDNFLEDWTH